MSSIVVEPLILEPLVEAVAPERLEKVGVPDLSLVDHVQVRLTAVLGEMELTVAELFDLKTGKVLALQQLLDDTIVLQLNGKAVATAHLVAVGDCFGVQIAQVL
ncbi:FliM/FliN family flagellar motor C-terminal domain-containing protein [Dyella silvatica]|uniref:FliM/FliN family flagellar motor C-terminal domain-containing protein n=1 Tax=Dyella silvatica TaxID=2992128 RepID=UPI0022598C9A|nr:FliM/FliN family flagellar motor C-terminal domain-containing protein [Dyella silvatica]